LDEHFSKTDITSVESHDLESQNEEMDLMSKNYFESVFNLTKPLNANINDNNDQNAINTLNDATLTKDMVIRSEKNINNHYHA